MYAHEHVVKLSLVSLGRSDINFQLEAHLLITDRELALRLLVLLRKVQKLLDRLCLRHLQAEFHILLRVLVARLDSVQYGSHLNRLRQHT